MSKITNSGILWIVIAGLLIITTPIWAHESLDLGEFKTSKLFPLLSSLLLIALFVERTLEVFLTTWRGPVAAGKDRDIELKNKEISNMESQVPKETDEIDGARDELKEFVKGREEYRMQTRSLSLGLGLFAGVLVSAVGIRALRELVASVPAEGLQAIFFNFVDIVLTGCLIAGGSDGIHKISELYNSFIGSTTKIADERGKKAGKQP